MLLFSSAYNEYTVISKEYTGPLDFDITGVDCKYIYIYIYSGSRLMSYLWFKLELWNLLITV